MQFNNRFTQSLTALLLTYVIFMATRLTMFFMYPEDFSTLTAPELILSLLYGLRVDTAIIFTFTGPLFLLLTLPVKALHERALRAALGAVWGGIVAFITIFNFGDILYFGFVHRHVMHELQVIGNDLNILTEMALNFYLPHTLAAVAGLLLSIALFAKLFSLPLRHLPQSAKAWWMLPLVLVVLFVGVRGKVTGISFGVSDAFAVNKMASGNLALNGFFCIYRSGTTANINHAHFPVNEAVKNVKTMLASPKIEYVDPAYPMLRRYVTDQPPAKHNVVIIMLESWSARYIDSFEQNDYNATPNFDRLAREGVRFTNFYANGQRSADGINSIFTGISRPFGFNAFGEGLELYGLSYIGRMAQQNGYSTISMQSSNRGSFRVDKLSELAGFTEYYGAEDMPHVGEEQGTPYYGVWDGDMLDFLFKKIDEAPKPFLSFAFTASTHAPYFSPGAKWELYPHDDNSNKGFLNTLHYVDAMIGRFMDKASKQPWFENTIFIFTADHCMGYDFYQERFKAGRMLPKNHIPLLVYAPGIFAPSINTTYGSQNDILPTLAHILQWQTPFATASQSLFDDAAAYRFAPIQLGNVIALTDGSASVSYNFRTFMEPEGDPAAYERLQKELLSFDTVVAELLRNNKWDPNQ